jgi:hypothetical protein
LPEKWIRISQYPEDIRTIDPDGASRPTSREIQLGQYLPRDSSPIIGSRLPHANVNSSVIPRERIWPRRESDKCGKNRRRINFPRIFHLASAGGSSRPFWERAIVPLRPHGKTGTYFPERDAFTPDPDPTNKYGGSQDRVRRKKVFATVGLRV